MHSTEKTNEKKQDKTKKNVQKLKVDILSLRYIYCGERTGLDDDDSDDFFSTTSFRKIHNLFFEDKNFFSIIRLMTRDINRRLANKPHGCAS